MLQIVIALYADIQVQTLNGFKMHVPLIKYVYGTRILIPMHYKVAVELLIGHLSETYIIYRKIIYYLNEYSPGQWSVYLDILITGIPYIYRCQRQTKILPLTCLLLS